MTLLDLIIAWWDGITVNVLDVADKAETLFIVLIISFTILISKSLYDYYKNNPKIKEYT